jgi:transketolase
MRQVCALHGPCYVRLGRYAGLWYMVKKRRLRLENGNLLQDGDDITIIATGIMVNEALVGP